MDLKGLRITHFEGITLNIGHWTESAKFENEHILKEQEYIRKTIANTMEKLRLWQEFVVSPENIDIVRQQIMLRWNK